MASERGDHSTNIDQASFLNIKRLMEPFYQGGENAMLGAYMLNAPQISGACLLTSVTVNLVTVLCMLIRIHGIRIRADQKEHCRMVHAVMRAKPEAVLTNDLAGRYLQILRVVQKLTIGQVSSDMSITDYRAAGTCPVFVAHDSDHLSGP